MPLPAERASSREPSQPPECLDSLMAQTMTASPYNSLRHALGRPPTSWVVGLVSMISQFLLPLMTTPLARVGFLINGLKQYFVWPLI